MGLFGSLFGRKNQQVDPLELNPKSLESLIRDAQIGPTVRVGEGAALYPIYVARGYDLVLVTWDGAVRKKQVRIETYDASIGRAEIINKGSSAVLMPAGVVMPAKGYEQQPRITTVPIIVPPKETVITSSLSCGYQRGGISATELKPHDSLYVFPSARIQLKDQGGFWQYISQVGQSGIFDNVEERSNLAQLLVSEDYRARMDSFFSELKGIPRSLREGSIFGHLIIYLDPCSKDVQVFLEGYGNSRLYLASRHGMMKGVAGQGVVSKPAAIRHNIDVSNEFSRNKVYELLIAFSRQELGTPVTPSAEYGVRVDAIMYEGKPAHFEGSAIPLPKPALPRGFLIPDERSNPLLR